MRTIDGVRVHASLHAAQRAVQRVPRMQNLDLRAASYWVEGEACRALLAGRKAKTCPGWCTREEHEGAMRRAKARRHGTMRFVWDAQETVAILLSRKGGENGPMWLVVTVLANEPVSG